MVEKEKYLVVVSVLEGRNFPKRSGFQLLSEARFDGELLATDPVSHSDHPEFTQELAWELNKKSLHQHRLQRSSIKVQVYAINTQSSAREPIGYVVLDLRSATTQQATKWLPLLHSKYQKTKPEIRVGLYVDEDKGPALEQPGFKAREAPARTASGPIVSESSSTEISSLELRKLKPILNEAEGLYQIGPLDKCTENFVLSVTIAFATNLPQLIPTSIALPNTGFFFYYSLLGNDVTNESFPDLINPNFPAERASVRVRSQVDILRMFFSKQPGLQLHLCCGDQSLGSADIPLSSLIKKGSTEIYMKPLTIEGAFPLVPPNRLKQKLGPIPDDLRPMVGVSVALRKEDVVVPGTPRVGTDAPGTHIDEQTQTPRGKKSAKDSVKQTPPEKLDSTKSKDGSKVQSPERRSNHQSSSPPHDGSYTDTFDPSSKTDESVPSLREDRSKSGAPSKVASPKRVAIQETPDFISDRTLSQLSGSKSGPQLPTPNIPVMTVKHDANGYGGTETKHYCCSIDLRSLQNIELPHPANVFLRYTYAFFGSVSPIFTHPPVEIRRGTEVVLPQSFCAFDFATSEIQILDTFQRIPLVVEVWNRDKQGSQNVLLGAAKIPLHIVLQEEKARAVHNNGSNGWRQVWSERLPVVANEGDPRKIAEMQVVVSLDDWGALDMPQRTTSSSSTGPTSTSSGQPPATSPRQTMEYKTAMELEMWKEQQEAAFEEQLREKEKQYMLALAEEWKRRNKDRELVLQKQMTAYTNMEEQLKVTIADLNKRERQLAANEQEVVRLRADLQREHERKMTEMREASRRMAEDCEHKVSLEKNKVKDLEETIYKLKQQLGEAEAKYQKLDKEFRSFRDDQNAKPEVRLQSEINLLTLEKVELERKIEAATKSKVHYKQQWGRALKELARLKQREQAVAKQELRRQQQEIQHMRLRYLAAEEKEVVNSDKQELEELKKQIHQLKEAEEAKKKQLADMSAIGVHGMEDMTSTFPDPESVEDEHISRLIEERDTLLRTGVYTTDDKIITELDRQIREAIGKKGRIEATTAIINDYHTKQQRPHEMIIR